MQLYEGETYDQFFDAVTAFQLMMILSLAAGLAYGRRRGRLPVRAAVLHNAMYLVWALVVTAFFAASLAVWAVSFFVLFSFLTPSAADGGKARGSTRNGLCTFGRGPFCFSRRRHSSSAACRYWPIIYPCAYTLCPMKSVRLRQAVCFWDFSFPIRTGNCRYKACLTAPFFVDTIKLYFCYFTGREMRHDINDEGHLYTFFFLPCLQYAVM